MRTFPALILMLAPALALASPPPSADQDQQMMDRLSAKFAKADVNHDGKLTKAEAEAGMPRLAEHFDDIDTEHKGYLTLDQLKLFMQFIQSRRGG